MVDTEVLSYIKEKRLYYGTGMSDNKNQKQMDKQVTEFSPTEKSKKAIFRMERLILKTMEG